MRLIPKENKPVSVSFYSQTFGAYGYEIRVLVNGKLNFSFFVNVYAQRPDYNKIKLFY